MATSKTKNYGLDKILLPQERLALIRFNKEVAMYSNAHWVNILKCREYALDVLGGDVRQLVMAFMHLWPHWFLNGRREKALGTEEQCREVCMEVLSKLEGSQSTCHFDYIKELYISSGYSIVPTGRRPLTLPCDKEGYAENS